MPTPTVSRCQVRRRRKTEVTSSSKTGFSSGFSAGRADSGAVARRLGAERRTPVTPRLKKGRPFASSNHHCPRWVWPNRTKPAAPRSVSGLKSEKVGRGDFLAEAIARTLRVHAPKEKRAVCAAASIAAAPSPPRWRITHLRKGFRILFPGSKSPCPPVVLGKVDSAFVRAPNRFLPRRGARISGAAARVSIALIREREIRVGTSVIFAPLRGKKFRGLDFGCPSILARGLS